MWTIPSRCSSCPRSLEGAFSRPFFRKKLDRLSILGRSKRREDEPALYRAPTKKRKNTMKFMILMIPSVYRDNKQPEPDFLDPKVIEEMGKFNEWLS